MVEKLSDLFFFYNDAVLGIREKKIVFFNPATRKILSGIEVGCQADMFFSSEVLGKCGGGFAASVNINSRPMRISGSAIDDIAVFILSPENGLDSEHAGMIESINFQMRESLSVLSVSLELLSSAIERLERPDMESHMSITLHNYYKLSRIAQNLSTYTDITGDNSANISFSPKNTDVVALLSELISTIRSLTKAQSVSLSFECKESSHIVAVDREKFTQMILNLLSNSLKNVDMSGSIVVSFKASKGKIIIGVSDTGKGIPPNQLYSVLGKFDEEQAHSDISIGKGLGLSVAAHIANLHGGSLLVESREGVGTTISITVPDKVVSSELLRENILDTESAGIRNIYTQLSDVLPSEAYSHKYLD